MMLQIARLLVATVVIVLCASAAAPAQEGSKVDVTGKWVLTVESAAGTSMPTATFKQEGEKLTGHYSSMVVGEAELSGTVEGQSIEFRVQGQVQDTQIVLTFTGTLEGKDSMKGKMSAGQFGDGTFSAKRQ